MKKQVEMLVWSRARSRCEYCRMSQRHVPQRHQIDHVAAKFHRGSDLADNLALSCYWCNRYKGPNLSGIDPQTGRIARLFNPRRDVWTDHFQWRGAWLIGKSAIGRTTIATLHMNDQPMIELREGLMED